MKPSKRSFTVAGVKTQALVYRAQRPAQSRAKKGAGDGDAPTLVFAPGAGAGQTHAFLVAFARGLAARGIHVVTFDFLYRAAGRSLPDRNDKLEACWRAALAIARAATGEARPFVGGKSMGGRIVSQLCAQGLDTAGLVLLGYPLHPPKQPHKLRIAHLPQLAARALPTLIVQGARDPFGTAAELAPYFPPPVEIVTLPGGHSLDDAALPAAEARVARFLSPPT